jgi:ketosteroid isomerase-like protein
MTEESTTPDLVGAIRASVEAFNRRDFDAAFAAIAPDVWDTSALGLGVYEGREAVRAFAEDWVRTYDDWSAELEEIRNLGNGVVFYVLGHSGRIAGSSSLVELRHSYTAVADGLVVRVTVHADIDEARAAAERLTEDRG